MECVGAYANYQFEVCLIVIFTFLYDFAVLRFASTWHCEAASTRPHIVRPDVRFCRDHDRLIKVDPCVRMAVRTDIYVLLINEAHCLKTPLKLIHIWRTVCWGEANIDSVCIGASGTADANLFTRVYKCLSFKEAFLTFMSVINWGLPFS